MELLCIADNSDKQNNTYDVLNRDSQYSHRDYTCLDTSNHMAADPQENNPGLGFTAGAAATSNTNSDSDESVYTGDGQSVSFRAGRHNNYLDVLSYNDNNDLLPLATGMSVNGYLHFISSLQYFAPNKTAISAQDDLHNAYMDDQSSAAGPSMAVVVDDSHILPADVIGTNNAVYEGRPEDNTYNEITSYAQDTADTNDSSMSEDTIYNITDDNTFCSAHAAMYVYV